MLAGYDRTVDDGFDVCAVEPSIGGCPSLSNVKIDFPTLLALFLVSNGYMTRTQSSQLGFDVTDIEARIQAQATAWYVYLRSGECVPATTPATPADLISFDRENGLNDEVDVLKTGADGKPTMVRVSEPETGGLESVYMFFRGPETCQDDRQQQQQKLDALR